VVQIAEFVGEVLQHLEEDKASLFAAIRVDHLWYNCGIDILWIAPKRLALDRVAPERHQYFCGLVVEISASKVFPPNPSLELPRLRSAY
jgi:hypothetical protein